MSSDSVIGPSSVVRGNVRGEGSLEIRGRIEGDVSVTGDVLVGEGSAVKGNISGSRISILGAVQGDLHGSEAVLIERGGKVAGDVSAPRIGIANGAFVRGTVRTEGEPALGGRRNSPAARSAERGPAFAPKAPVKAEPKPPPPLAAVASASMMDSEAPEAPTAALPRRELREKPPERRPPPPVLPSLGKGAKAKKKKGRE